VLRQPAATATESWLDELGRGAGRRERAGRSVWLAVASSSRLGSPGCCLRAPPSGMGLAASYKSPTARRPAMILKAVWPIQTSSMERTRTGPGLAGAKGRLPRAGP
jgi:hypothetical protein